MTDGDGSGAYAAAEFKNLIDILRFRAAVSSARCAFTFLTGAGVEANRTYGELDEQARVIGAHLLTKGLCGKPVLLICPQGLEYIAAFFGCLYAGAVAVPAYLPRRSLMGNRLSSIAVDACASAVLGTTSVLDTLAAHREHMPALAACQWLDVEHLDPALAPSWREPSIDKDTVAVIQYTSGSTSAPRGVALTHSNILHQQQVLQRAYATTESSVCVSWLPFYHDMGLMGSVVQPVFTGARCVLIPPSAFLQKPRRWLEAVSRYQATTSGGPNYGYDLCVERIGRQDRVGLDLASWQIACNGSEPLRKPTLDRFAEAFGPWGFRREAFYPCYGLAEATLMVASKRPDRAVTSLRVNAEELAQNRVVIAGGDAPAEGAPVMLVSSGTPQPEQTLIIADLGTMTELPAGSIGEIWISGPSVAQGYWRRPEETATSFGAYLSDTGSGPFLRTGDLGFLCGGELFVTGRIKDLIVIRGRNYYPQDVESAASESHPALVTGAAAAFSIDINGQERVVITQEVHRRSGQEILTEAAQAIRRAVASALELPVYDVVLLKQGSIARTSSGKIRRHECRAKYLRSALECLGRWTLGQTAGASVESIPSTTPEQETHGNEEISAARARELVEWLRAYADERINSRLIDERRSIPPYVVLDFGNQGILGMQVEERHGGLALRNRDVMPVIEQLAAIDLTLALFVGNNNALGVLPIRNHGSDSLRSELLPSLARGRQLAAFALTESGAGSNPRAITAKATADSRGGWRLNGAKVWSGSAAWAGVINVFVRTSDRRSDPTGITGFAVPQGSKGLRHGPEALTLGMRGMVQNTVYFNDVAVGRDNLLGELGRGLDVAQDAMMVGRLGLGATSVGGMKRCAQLMLRYARRRSISTGRLLDNPVSLTRFSELTATIDLVRSLVYRVAELLDAGVAVSPEVFAVCKTAGSEHLWRAADWLVQMLGGRGYLESNIAAQILRDARVFRIFEGPTETLNMFVGARVLHQGEDLYRFLAERFHAPVVAEKLRDAVEEIHGRHLETHNSVLDRPSALRWAHMMAGEVASCALLWAAVGDRRAQSGRFEKAAAWGEWGFEQAVAQALNGLTERSWLLDADQTCDIVSSYSETIGDAEQAMAGEDGALDWLLRRDASGSGARRPPLPEAQGFTGPERIDQSPPNAAPTAAGPSAIGSDAIADWLAQWLRRELGLPAAEIQAHQAFADLGLDSSHAVMLAGALQEWLGIRLDATLVWDYPNIAALARYLANELKSLDGAIPAAIRTSETSPTVDEADLSRAIPAGQGK